jgi:hypothetical protein
MLHENPHIWIEIVTTLNPATLLPVDPGHLEHDCLRAIDEVSLSWPEITDQSNGSPDAEYFTDGSSIIQ